MYRIKTKHRQGYNDNQHFRKKGIDTTKTEHRQVAGKPAIVPNGRKRGNHQPKNNIIFSFFTEHQPMEYGAFVKGEG